MKVRTTCPGCSTRYVLPAEGIPPEGRRVACRHCGQQWTIPHPGGQNAPRAATPAEARPQPPSQGSPTERVVSCPHCDFNFLASAALPLQQDRRTILIVEDQSFFRTVIREALGEGYHFVVAESVDQAKAVIGAVSIDLVLLDLNLQEAGDGEKLLEFLPDELPTLILTGDQDPDLYGDRWRKLQEQGARDLLIKGLNIREQLAAKVDCLLEAKRAAG